MVIVSTSFTRRQPRSCAVGLFRPVIERGALVVPLLLRSSAGVFALVPSLSLLGRNEFPSAFVWVFAVLLALLNFPFGAALYVLAAKFHFTKLLCLTYGVAQKSSDYLSINQSCAPFYLQKLPNPSRKRSR